MQQRLRERWDSFTKEQRLSVILLGFCGFFAVVLSLYQMNMNVHGPFLTDKAQALAFKQSLTPSPDQDEAKQKRTDTDGDGLSDWDELNVYHLNPNLKDTCGDGVLDNIRVATGKHLVCTNATPGAGSIDTSQLETTTSSYTNIQQAANGSQSIVSQALGATEALPTGQVDQTGAAAPSTIPRDPQAIRQALQGQVSADVLNSVSDEQLLKYYDQAVLQQNASASGTTSGSTTSTTL